MSEHSAEMVCHHSIVQDDCPACLVGAAHRAPHAEGVCPSFRPIESEYRPIGQLYRQVAKEVCINCGRYKAEHLDGGQDA